MLEEKTHGYNPIAKQILNVIKRNKDRGTEITEIIDKTGYSRKTVEKFLQYLLGKGEITVEKTAANRYYPTYNKELIVNDNTNKELTKYMRKAVNQVKKQADSKGKKYRIIVQQVR